MQGWQTPYLGLRDLPRELTEFELQAAKVLAQQLRELEADALVSRARSGPVPAVVLYALTPHGHSVLPVAEEVRLWGKAHQAAHAGDGRSKATVDGRAACDVPITSADHRKSAAPSS